MVGQTSIFLQVQLSKLALPCFYCSLFNIRTKQTRIPFLRIIYKQLTARFRDAVNTLLEFTC